jgi:FeS assembly SUF system protein
MFKKLKDFFYSNEEETTPISNRKEQVIQALKTVYDPEIPVNIYDLGLIYHIAITDDQNVQIQMTLTSPGCPVAETFPQTVMDAVKSHIDDIEVTVELVWDPPWTMDRMGDAAKLQLNLL